MSNLVHISLKVIALSPLDTWPNQKLTRYHSIRNIRLKSSHFKLCPGIKLITLKFFPQIKVIILSLLTKGDHFKL